MNINWPAHGKVMTFRMTPTCRKDLIFFEEFMARYFEPGYDMTAGDVIRSAIHAAAEAGKQACVDIAERIARIERMRQCQTNKFPEPTLPPSTPSPTNGQ